MVPAPMFDSDPISASPKYAKWFALEPFPIFDFFVSTKLPIFASLSIWLPSLNLAYGPIEQLLPIFDETI